MIKEREKELFRKWISDRGMDNPFQLFLKDGVFDEDEWGKQSVKILYVLKEANFKISKAETLKRYKDLNIKDFDDDLCKYLLSEKSPTYWKTWNNIVRWTQAIRFGGKYQKTITKSDKSECLKTIAALNIKKEAGGAVAIDEKIRKYGERDKDYIRNQIELYQPDIIVCCGRGKGKNADILYNHVLTVKADWQKTENGYRYFLCTLESNKRVPVLSFRHPQMWGGHKAFEESYSAMVKIANEFKTRNIL